MQTNKIFAILSIIGIFIIFSIFDVFQKSDKVVLKIFTPTKIGVDLNSNKILEDDEIICISSTETFTANLSELDDNLYKKIGISKSDAIKLGYITDNFAENTLLERNVKLKFTKEQNQDCKFADINVDNISYKKQLLISGLGFENGNITYLNNYKKQLDKAKRLKLVILNHKSNKYHTLDCKYGLVASDAVVIEEKQLPKESVPCKFCHITKQKNIKKTIPQYPLMISHGSVKLFLTDLTTKLKPDNKCSSLACKEIVNQIKNSKSSIDIALYGWSNTPEIINALINAKSRGVKIRLVYDTSKGNYYPDINLIINLADEKSTDTPKIIMHNKFIIFDNSKVITGSMNFANTGLSGFNSDCLILINSEQLAQIYEQEFNQMLSGKFHNEKEKFRTETITLKNARILPLFSPKDKIISTNIIPLINKAEKYIYIPTFVLTHEELKNSLINAKKRGVKIKIIHDATNYKASNIKTLRENGILVKIENYAGKVHSKTMIIDDKYLIIGSMNFSKNGENKNDENVLIIENKILAKYYRGFFEYLWQKIPERYLNQGVRSEGKYSIGSCSDGIDNNFDGKIDKDDFGCK